MTRPFIAAIETLVAVAAGLWAAYEFKRNMEE